MVDEQNIKTE